jgi:hypothetical protein
MKAIWKPYGCGPFAAWGVLEHFGKRPNPEKIIAACRYRGRGSTYLADIAAALVEFGLAVEYSANHGRVAGATGESIAADRRARSAGVQFSRARALRDMAPLLDGSRVAILTFNTDQGGLHAHIAPLTEIHDKKAIMPFDDGSFSPMDLDVLEFLRGHHLIQQECLQVTEVDASPPDAREVQP